MIRKSLLISLLVLVTAAVATAGDKAGDQAWFDKTCSMCSNMYGNEGLIEHMSWEQLDLRNGIISITTVDEKYLPDYRKAKVGMMETMAKMHSGEELHICGSCQYLGKCMMQGPDQDYVQTSTGDIMILTSGDEELVAELQKWVAKNK